MVALDERLLNTPNSHLVGPVEGQKDSREEGPVYLRRTGHDTVSYSIISYRTVLSVSWGTGTPFSFVF